MSGSNLKMTQKNTNLIEGDHRKLSGRIYPGQHPLDAIYRMGDNKSLRQILEELERSGKEVTYEFIDNLEDGQTIVKLSKFTYNPSADLLLVSLCGIDVYAGIENQFIQTGPDEITFNFPLRAKYDLLVVLAGSMSGESFGDLYDYGIRQFRQLVDVPNSYHGQGGKVVYVSESETGLQFGIPNLPMNLKKYNNDDTKLAINHNDRFRGWFPLTNKGIIKCIMVTPDDEGYTGNFELKVWTKEEGGHYVYYSGDEIISILYDIMDIPFIDESGSDAVFIELWNKGPSANFEIQMFVLE